MEFEVPAIVKEFFEKFPHFQDGRINYSNCKEAVAINIIVKFRSKILILKRSDKVGMAREKWAFIGGHFDELKTIKEKTLEELYEETGINENQIKEIIFGESYHYFEQEINRDWIIFPVLVRLSEEPNIIMNYEHTDFLWISPKNLPKYNPQGSVQKICNYFFV